MRLLVIVIHKGIMMTIPYSNDEVMMQIHWLRVGTPRPNSGCNEAADIMQSLLEDRQRQSTSSSKEERRDAKRYRSLRLIIVRGDIRITSPNMTEISEEKLDRIVDQQMFINARQNGEPYVYTKEEIEREARWMREQGFTFWAIMLEDLFQTMRSYKDE